MTFETKEFISREYFEARMSTLCQLNIKLQKRVDRLELEHDKLTDRVVFLLELLHGSYKGGPNVGDKK